MEKFTRRQFLTGAGALVGSIAIGELARRGNTSIPVMPEPTPYPFIEKKSTTVPDPVSLDELGLSNIVTESDIPGTRLEALELDVAGKKPDFVITTLESDLTHEGSDRFQVNIYEHPREKTWGIKINSNEESFSLSTDLIVPEENGKSTSGKEYIPLVELDESTVNKFMKKKGELDVVIFQAENKMIADQFSTQYINGAAFAGEPEQMAFTITVTTKEGIPYSTIYQLPTV